MDDRYWDYADEWSVTDDPGFEDAAREWADDNRDELVAAYAEGDLVDATIQAHQDCWPVVERSLERAKARTASGDLDEAAFHLSRTLEGYVRAVYLTPLFDAMTRAFDDRLKISQLHMKDIVPSQLRNAGRLLLFALVGITNDPKDAIEIRKTIKRAVDGIHWQTRNEVSHTLLMPSVEAVSALEAEVGRTLDIASKPLKERIAADDARRAAYATERKRSLADLPF